MVILKAIIRYGCLGGVVLIALLSCSLTKTDSEHSWTLKEKAILRSLWLESLPPIPADPSNRFADDPSAIEFGKRFFFDTRFSANNEVACASCHQPQKFFTDGMALSNGIARTPRGAPSLMGTAYSPWLYWDGRRDSHWAQALVPLETPIEHGSSRQAVLRNIRDDSVYRQAYINLFGNLPENLSRNSDDVNRAFANIGKAVAAFERTLQVTPSRFDHYVASVLEESKRESLLSEQEIAGLRLFMSEQAQCTRCHNGPLFTNFGFHNIGLVELKRGVRKYDFGRIKGLVKVQKDPFNCLGPYSDANSEQCQELKFLKKEGAELVGAFKVPTLRNISETSPYMHDGRFADLHEVIKHYKEAPIGRAGHQELNPISLTSAQIEQLVAFLGTLTGSVPRIAP